MRAAWLDFKRKGTPVTQTAQSAGAKTVLVVDDDELLCALTVSQLRSRGYRAVVTTDGEDAIRKIKDGAPPIDALLVDINMRPVSGREILARARCLKPGLPVIMMSGAHKEDLAEPLEEGPGLAFLLKPFSSDDLAKALSAATA
jgi:CheY-like chemotaxis protein